MFPKAKTNKAMNPASGPATSDSRTGGVRANTNSATVCAAVRRRLCESQSPEAQRNRSERTVLNTHLIPHLGDKALDQITTEDVQRLKSALEQRAAKTVNNC